jgi:hypothetical protein
MLSLIPMCLKMLQWANLLSESRQMSFWRGLFRLTCRTWACRVVAMVCLYLNDLNSMAEHHLVSWKVSTGHHDKFHAIHFASLHAIYIGRYNGSVVPVTAFTFYNTISLVRPTSLSSTRTFRRVGGAYIGFWERRRSFQKVELPSSFDASRRIEAFRN